MICHRAKKKISLPTLMKEHSKKFIFSIEFHISQPFTT